MSNRPVDVSMTFHIYHEEDMDRVNRAIGQMGAITWTVRTHEANLVDVTTFGDNWRNLVWNGATVTLEGFIPGYWTKERV